MSRSATGLLAHPGESARHWVEASVPDRAFAAAVDAAGRAEAAHAPQDALVALELALLLSEPAAPTIGRAGAGSGRSAARQSPGGEVITALQLRAAEAAFAAERPARAAAYVEALIGRFDERRDRLALGVLYERLGKYRRAAGDRVGALAALERAVDLVPPAPSVERAGVLASLAQVRMIDGTFGPAESLAREAIRMAEGLGPAGDAVRLHATTTLGVTLGWGDQPEEAVALLRESLALARDRGDLDELFRVYANLTTVLDLLGRRGEAVDVANEGVEASRRAGLEAVFGNFLRANASDSLYLLGRWAESSAISATALEWSPGGAIARPIDSLAMVEIETNGGEVAGRQLGQILVGLDTVSDAQHAVPIYRAAASLALWQGDHADAGRAAARGWELVKGGGDWSLIAKMASTVAEVDSAAAADAMGRRDLAALAAIRARSRDVLKAARSAVERSRVEATVGSRREADAWLAQASAHRERLEARDDPANWDRLAGLWKGLANPYELAKAAGTRPRRSSVPARAGPPGRGRGRRSRRRPGSRVDLGARPLLREVRELAGRAMIRLPAARGARTGVRRWRRSHGRATGTKPGPSSPSAPGHPTGSTPATGRRAAAGPATAADRRMAPGPRMRGRRSSEASSATPRPRAGTRSGSRTASARSSRSSPRAGPTGRSASACSSARRRSASTSATSSPSSACPDGSRPPPSRSGSG